MYKFVIRCVNGDFQGLRYYNTTKAALEAAINQTNYTGMPWYVDAVKVR